MIRISLFSSLLFSSLCSVGDAFEDIEGYDLLNSGDAPVADLSQISFATASKSGAGSSGEAYVVHALKAQPLVMEDDPYAFIFRELADVPGMQVSSTFLSVYCIGLCWFVLTFFVLVCEVWLTPDSV